ncbi:TldD/PmbA family protein [Caldimonas sp. KR1-144]|uniref:TldD/PmbA family protein n=1 Tax=Caldimonas sp. KR1-144 TaxID=3400911 RepID=UPI003C105EE3
MDARVQLNPLTRREGFEALADALLGTPEARHGADRTTLLVSAESSDFLRFNRGTLRQATQVSQAYATLAVERGQRRTEATVALSGDLSRDLATLSSERAELLRDLDLIPDDPWLLVPDAASTSSRDDHGRLPEAAQLIALVHGLAAGKHDFVGFYAGGPMVRAFADTLGSRHWHRVESFHFDWCLYRQADKAIKTAYAGTHWDDAAFVARFDEVAARVPLLAREPRTLKPGAYRAAFTPTALVEILGTLGWSGFSLKSRRTGVSSLMRLERGEAAFAPSLHIDEAVASGTAPAFTAEGFTRPASVPLVTAGRLPREGGTLNSPRSAREYGVATNGADAQESPDSLRVAAGSIAHSEMLRALDTGLYVSNLWYLNYSDRQACRMTGMTRYACFWVEGGELVAPVNVMRFDDDALRLLGDGLVGLTDEAEFLPNSDTYGQRQLGSITTPGAVIEGFRLTL